MNETEPKNPRYWKTLEELDGSTDVERLRSEEFFEKPAEIMNEAGEVNFHLSRRDLLKLSGAAMVFAAVGCARRPVEKIIPYVVAPEEITPGIPVWYASTCSGCSAGCGVLVKSREGRPIKLEGNPKHPINHGKLCARGQATVLDLYDPDRLQQPVKYGRGKQTPENLTFDQVDNEILAVLKSKTRIALIAPQPNGIAARRALREFLSAYPNVDLFGYDPLGDDDLLRAQQICYGIKETDANKSVDAAVPELLNTTIGEKAKKPVQVAARPRYRFDAAEYILSLGADPFGASISPVEASYGYGLQRKPGNNGMVKLVCFEPAITMSGANADERFLVTPEHYVKIAYTLANILVQSGSKLFDKDDDNQRLRAKLAKFDATQIEQEAGLPSELLSRLAKEIKKYRGRSLVIGGDIAVQNAYTESLHVAIALLNSLLDNDGKTVDGATVFSQQRTGTQRAILRAQAALESGNYGAAIIAGVNPVYTAPFIREQLEKVKFIAVLSDRIDETARHADFIIPLSHGLEAWTDYQPENGIFAIRQPTITPLYNTRSIEENYLTWTVAKTKGKALTMLEFIQDTWKQAFMKEASQSSFTDWWEDRLREGVFASVKTDVNRESRKFNIEAIDHFTVNPSPVSNNALSFVLQVSPLAHAGTQRNNTWLMETPDPVTKVSWDNYLSIAPATAKKLDLHTEDVVMVTVGKQTVEAPVFIQPGIHPDVVALSLGWGRTAAGRVGNNVGVNGFAFAQYDRERIIFSGLPVTLTKTGFTHRLANMAGHNFTEGRPVVQETTLDKWRDKPDSGGRKPETPESIWGDPPAKLNPPTGEPIRWGMTIDVNSCIGCNACSVACQAENNVAVVGKEEVLRGREMSWIRIDRYYSGELDNPEVTYSPMLCQQCSHAPCETVCPVVATTHNDEGLNVQTYNRCVGTRYCSNNCPYKVRRFNWLIDNTAYSPRNIQHPMEMVLNPDVTVRSIGVMEKCTFCIQRIRVGHEYRKANGLHTIPDGQVKPACAQTCPTQAITFGNLLNQESEVSKVAQDPRGYQVLDDLNTRPAITYLRKVRNRMPKSWDNDDSEKGHA